MCRIGCSCDCARRPIRPGDGIGLLTNEEVQNYEATEGASRAYPAVLLKNPHNVFGNGDRQDGNRDGKSRLFEDGHAERPSATTICEATKIPILALTSRMILTAP